MIMMANDGPINENGMWRIRHNKEIYDLFKEPKISTLVKLKRLQWARHVQGMDEGRIPKRVMTGVMFGRRLVGKPKKRWMDSVKEDSYQHFQSKNWQQRAFLFKGRSF